MILTFTDFGLGGPYLGQVRCVLAERAPGVAVIDLVTDAPVFDPRASAYLLAALIPVWPPRSVGLCVVDPGVGGERGAVVAALDGHLLVGPDNGLFEIALRRARATRVWDIVWRPDRLAATFHGRDLFAPVAAALARGETPDAAGCRPGQIGRHPDWPDDWERVVYIDGYGNAMTGMRAATMPREAVLEAGGCRLAWAETFCAVPAGAGFWYENSCGLVEIAVNGGRADQILGLRIGSPVARLTGP